MASEAIEETLAPGTRGSDVEIGTDASRLDLDMVHGFLAGSYWAAGTRARSSSERSGTRCASGHMSEIVRWASRGWSPIARPLPTSATSSCCPRSGAGAWAAGSWRPSSGHPDLQGLRRWTLFTRDAHALYRRFGFGDARYPDRLMEIFTDPYAPAG